MAELTQDALRQMAALSGVPLSSEELELMQGQVEAISEGIARVTEVDVGETGPHTFPRPIRS